MSLKYSISHGILSGTVGNKQFNLLASSGGGRGRKGKGAETSAASYDVYRKEKGDPKAADHVHGGPIPSGLYICVYVKEHPTFGECVRLDQTITSMVGLDGKTHMP